MKILNLQSLKNSILNPYKNLSKEIWVLALLTLINRAGAMVIPFLSLYLTASLGFSLKNVGWIMTFYGLGSLIGTFIGGKLVDRIGYHKLMYLSLFISSFLFFGLQFLKTLDQFIFGIFILSLFADMFRPAIWVAMDAYSTEDNKTRSVTLIRLAINLGFSVGPAVGGLIIATISYKGLFWLDSITTFIASIIVYKFLREVKNSNIESHKVIETKNISPYNDKQYLIFWFAMLLSGLVFVQFMYTFPLYYKEVIGLNEKQIGYLIALNGLLIFLLEMPLISFLLKKRSLHISMMILGSVLMILSFITLNIHTHVFYIISSIVFITLGEMFSFPFSNTYAMERSNGRNKGEYMALYTISFSVANIIGPNIGMHIVAKYGFSSLWYFSSFVLLLSIALLYWLKKIYLKSKNPTN
jgi:predicted MFS family arabinose efflux permease